MSLRPLTSTPDRLSSLGMAESDHKTSSDQQREQMADASMECAGLVQRCVIVQKDQLGFGFTVCGERVKLVQNVRPGGAADKAGVHEGDRIIKDSEVQKQASQILRKMLEQEEAELQALQEALALSPSPLLEQRLQSAKRRAHQVKLKIQQDLDGARFESGANYMKAGEGGPSDDSTEGDLEAWRPQIIGPDEDDDEDHCAMTEMDGLFQDVELLKSRPAHMTVFLRYIFSQHLDPSPLLFFLSVEAYLGSTPKDARALAPQICAHFLDPDAPLKIRIREDYMSDIESRLQAQEDIRGPLSELQQRVLPVIQEQIQGYRSKQLLGLGALFGEGDLQQLDGDPGKERQVVDKQVTALWDILLKHEQERSVPLASAVNLYLRNSGIKLREPRPPGLAAEKDRWLTFFPKAKKLSSTKRDAEDRKRNPILKYIGNKPRGNQPCTTPAHTHTYTVP